MMIREIVLISKTEIICLEETKIQLPIPRYMRAIFPLKIVKVFCKEAIGASSGILVGINHTTFEILDNSIGK